MSATTWGQLITIAVDHTVNANIALTCDRFDTPGDAAQAVHAYRDLLHAISRHLHYLNGTLHAPNPDHHPDPRLASAARILTEHAARSLDETDQTTAPVARAWRAAAQATRAAHELLDTHLSVADGPRTPDAAVIADPAAQAAALQNLAEITDQAAAASKALAFRAREARPGDDSFVDLLDDAKLRRAAAAMRSYTLTHEPNAAIADIGLASPAPPVDADQLTRAAHVMNQLRAHVFRVATTTPDTSAVFLTDVARTAYTAHAHAAAITAAAARRLNMLGRASEGGDLAAQLPQASRAHNQAAAAWLAVSEQLTPCRIPGPNTSGSWHPNANTVSEALNSLTRDGTHWRAPERIIPDLATAHRMLAAVEQLTAGTAEIAAWQCRTVAAMTTRQWLLVPATSLSRDEISESPTLAAARLRKQYVPLPASHVDDLLAAYDRARDLSAATQTRHPHTAADAPTELTPTPSPRWVQACTSIDPRILDDPHWPALARALDHAADNGIDVDAVLTQLAARHDLPERHPARALHYRLIDTAETTIAAPPASVPANKTLPPLQNTARRPPVTPTPPVPR